ncbi:MAG: hypothetical protein NC130_10260, partial [Lachnoclostridium sp.]|nr:hypothetical protein [Lachnoclostridium sp.]
GATAPGSVDVIYYGIGAEPAGAFENADRGVERYAAARSKSRFGLLGLNPGFRYRYTRGYILESLRDSMHRIFGLCQKIHKPPACVILATQPHCYYKL